MVDEKAAKEEQMKQNALQQKYMEYQVAEQQMKQFQQQLEKLDQQKGEAAAVGDALEDFQRSTPGSEVLVPISGGIFFKTELKGSEKFLVNVGSGVVVEKDLAGVVSLVDNQVGEIENYHTQLMSEFTKLSIRFQTLEEELRRLVDQ